MIRFNFPCIYVKFIWSIFFLKDSSDPKKQKNHRRKTVNERPKKPMSSRSSTPHINVKGFPPKLSFNSKNMLLHSSNYYDWNPTLVPFPSRMTHSNGYHPDLPFMRRPRKVVRSVYLNDRHQWLKK